MQKRNSFVSSAPSVSQHCGDGVKRSALLPAHSVALGLEKKRSFIQLTQLTKKLCLSFHLEAPQTDEMERVAQ